MGLQWMWQMMSGQLRQDDGTLNDHLASARLVVGDSPQDFSPTDTRLAGENTDQAPLDDGYPIITGDTITFRSTFTENQGVFEWAERGVVTAQGVLLDRAVGDQGRKPLGASWRLEAILQLGN